MATQEEELFLVGLKARLGEDYIKIINEFTNQFRIISLNPLRLRHRASNEQQKRKLLSLDPDCARYFYLKSAATSDRDSFGKSAYKTVKYNAYKDFLSYCKTFANASKRAIYSLGAYQPSEIAKIAAHYPNLFKFDNDIGPGRKACIVEVINPEFSWEEFEKARTTIVDPFFFSRDEQPKLPKPIATIAPSQVRKITIQNETIVQEDVDWTTIKDDD